MRTNIKAHTISIPVSYVRPPGGLLAKKYSLDLQENKYKLERQTSIERSSLLDSQVVEDGVDEPSIANIDTSDDLKGFFNLHSISNSAGPGKLKNNSDDLSNLIQKTKKALSLFGITLSFDLSGKYYRDSANILNALAFEISLFSTEFFKKIKLDQLAISQTRSPNRGIPQNNFSLQVDMLDTEAKILERLYKIIFSHLIDAHSDILKSWEKQVKTKDLQPSENFSLEEVFVALMKNLNHPTLRQLTIKLRDLLASCYPEDLSKEWFENRMKIKKRTRRVSFSVSG